MIDRTPRAGRLALTACAAVLTLTSLSACGSGFSQSSSSSGAAASQSANSTPISVLIGSSGQAETTAVKNAVAAWSKQSGVKADVVVASDLVQQASQGFASGKPADVLYVSGDQIGAWASNGSLEAYGDNLKNKDDFYPKLREAFTYDNKLYCAPKDFSTLALIINKDMWSRAGLTDADVPTTWDQLESTARKLTTDKVKGLAMSPEIARVGAFLAQSGGGLESADRKTATADSDKNVAALTYVKKLLNEGVAAYSSQLGAGWGGEAFGKGQAAMVIEGNWIEGALKSDFPKVKYTVAELPAGPGGKGTLQFTNCWGLSADGKNKGAAQQLIQYLSSTEQQISFAKAFGVMPSVQSAADQYRAAFPQDKAFLAGASYAQNLPLQPGAADVIKDLNSKLEGLKTADPKSILTEAQSNLQPVVAGK
ncbi:extracellular solute-binding protein [Tersicoccus sp. MR15.9]|uniref:sugar ABC transporter substrate-binding protein n=1 Tax=Tersicoccus mangrovi TaxID=3121635 RepID=UPI002FE6A60D